MKRTICSRKARPAQTRAALIVALALGALGAAAPAGASPSLGTWNATGSGLGVQSGVSCPSAGLCVSVAGTNAEVSTAPTAASSWQIQGTGAAGALQAVSCAAGTSFCVAVGASGAVVVNASTGSSSSWSSPASGDTHPLTSVSCPTTSFCLAVDSSGGAVYSTSSGATWTPVTPGHTFKAVACASASLCAAIDAAGNIYVSTAPESAGSWSTVAFDGNANLSAIACATNGTCVAVDASGYAEATNGAGATPSTWSSTHVASSLSAVSCTPSGMCVATGSGSAYASDTPGGSSPAWASSSVSTTPTAVACTDQGLCAAVDGAGHADVATLPAPSATTGSATAITQTTATLAATVNPNDAILTNCYFEYGPTTAYGSSVPCSGSPSPTGGTQAVSAAISGLTAGTAYHVQVVASNAVGSGGGGDQTFTTAAPLRPTASISGTPAVGDTLTCGIGVTLPAGTSVSYAWVRDTTAIAGAVGATYVVALADETHHLYCSATIAGDGGTGSANSSYLAVPAETLGTVFETIVGAPSSTARSVTVPVTCSPQAVSSCTVALALTVVSHHHTLRLGSATRRIAVGAKANASVSLNSEGRSLLAHNRHLKVTLTVTGTIVGVIKGTLERRTVTFTTSHHARRR